jgi:hypothetical protein
MIDGSTSGSINFVNDGVIYIKDNDATALQVQEATNAYMTFDTSNGSEKVIISKDIQILSTDAGAAAAPTVDFFRNSSSPDDSDIMGKITFTGKDEGDNTHEYAAIQSEINDVTGAGEDGVLLFSILKNANTKSALELKNNEAVFNNNGADIDFRIETDDFSGFVFIDGNINTMSIGSGSAAVASGFPAPQAILEITNKASGFEDVPLLQLNNNDVDMVALDINAANTTAHAVHVTADALTTGNGVFIASNSSATDSRNVLCADQQNASATSAIPLFVNQAANAALSGTPVDGGTPVAYFRQANANTAFGPIIVLDRRNSTVADDMGVGLINFQAQNDNDDSLAYARISAEASDVSQASARGKLIFRAQLGHNSNEPEACEEMMHLGGQDVAAGVVPAVVINDQNYDIDFRVASSASTHALFVDGGSNFVRIDAAQGLHLKDLGTHASTPSSGFGVIYVNGDVPYFKTDGGTATSMIGGGGGSTSPGGSDTQIQYNNGGSFGGVASMTFDDSQGNLTIIDDKKLQFGTGNDASFEYDEDGTDTLLYAGASLRVSDDVKIEFGTGGDAHIEYDENGSDFMVVSGSGNGIAMSGSNIVMRSRTQTGLLLTSATHTLANITPSAGHLSATTPSLMFAGTNEAPLCRLFAIDGDDNCDTLILSSSYMQVTFGEKDSTNHFRVGKQTNEVIFKVDSTGVVINEGSKAANDFRVESDGEDQAIFLDSSENKLSINLGETAFTTEIHSTNDIAMSVGSAGVIFNEDGHETNDFRVEGTTETHLIFADASTDRVSIGDSTDDPAATLEVTNANDGGVPLVQLNNTDLDQIGLDINLSNTTAIGIDVDADNTTTNVLDITADALTTGGILNLVSNSSDTGNRTLLKVHNDNTAATGVQMVHFLNDAVGGLTDPILLVESTTGETEALLTLKQGGTSTSAGPTLRFDRSSGTTGATMEIGQIIFEAEDTGGTDRDYAKIQVFGHHGTINTSHVGLMDFITVVSGTDGSGNFVPEDYNVFRIGTKKGLAGDTVGGDFIYNPIGGDLDFPNSQFILSGSHNCGNFTFNPSGSVTSYGGGLGSAKGSFNRGFSFGTGIGGMGNEYGYGWASDGDVGNAVSFIPDFEFQRATTTDTFIVLNSGSQDADEATACVPDFANRMILFAPSNYMGKGLLISGIIRCSTSMLRTSGSATNFIEQYAGQPVYLGATSGTLDLAQPSTSLSGLAIVRICGHVLQYISSDSVLVDFRPSHDFFQI